MGAPLIIGLLVLLLVALAAVFYFMGNKMSSKSHKAPFSWFVSSKKTPGSSKCSSGIKGKKYTSCKPKPSSS